MNRIEGVALREWILPEPAGGVGGRRWRWRSDRVGSELLQAVSVVRDIRRKNIKTWIRRLGIILGISRGFKILLKR